MNAKRIANNPIITPSLHDSIGPNINGPSLIEVPEWVNNPLGNYYLYFASHQGKKIHLAYSDELSGPWNVTESGVLDLTEAGEGFDDHIASPDAHVLEDDKEIILYYHGAFAKYWEFSPHNSTLLTKAASELSNVVDFLGVPSVFSRLPVYKLLSKVPLIDTEATTQFTRMAVSSDGLSFHPYWEPVGIFYLRMFEYNGEMYALGKSNRGPNQTLSGQKIYKVMGRKTNLRPGPIILSDGSRHSAVRVRGDELDVFYSRIGDSPERILHSTVDLTEAWTEWEASEPETVIEPQFDWEGADLPTVPSVAGAATQPVNQLRDPAIFEDENTTYLLYTVAGERGIAIAELSE